MSKHEFRQKDYKLSIIGVPVDTILVYSKIVDLDALILKRNVLVNVQNTLIQAQNTAYLPKEYWGFIQFGFAKWLIDIILNNNAENNHDNTIRRDKAIEFIFRFLQVTCKLNQK